MTVKVRSQYYDNGTVRLPRSWYNWLELQHGKIVAVEFEVESEAKLVLRPIFERKNDDEYETTNHIKA